MIINYNYFNTIIVKCQYNQTVIFDSGGDFMGYYKRIRDLREDNDMTQQQVSDYLKMKQPQYSRYEKGYRDIPSDVLIALADLYNTTTDYILERTDNSNPIK